MEQKTITAREMAAIKRIAINSNANVVNKNKLKAKAEKLLKEVRAIEETIKLDEAGIIKKYGVTSENIVERKVVTTDKFNAKGQPVKVTKWEVTDNVTWDETKKVYILAIPEAEDEVHYDVPTDESVFNNEGEVVNE